MLPKNDKIRIKHMLDASNDIKSFIAGKTQKDIKNNRMLVLSVVKSIEIIGEAAAKISEETRGKFPQIPWQAIIAMRNRLIHGYFDIDPDRVWDTITIDLPPLVTKLRELIKN